MTTRAPVEKLRDLLAAILAAVLPTAGSVLRTEMWRHWSVPIDYNQDSLFTLADIQRIAESGWTLTSTRLAAPGTFDSSLFPSPSFLQFFLLKILVILGLEPGLCANTYFVATFGLVGLAGYLTLRLLRIERVLAVAGAFAYSFLPYHFLRGIGHIHLAGYFLVPPGIYCILTMASLTEKGLRGPLHPRDKRVHCALIALLMPTTGIYYAAFFGLLLFLVSLIKTSGRLLLFSAFLLALLTVSLFFNNLPYWLALRKAGTVAAFHRSPGDSEVYSLNFTALITPFFHYADSIRSWSARYLGSALLNENRAGSLGILPGLGMFYTLVAGLRQLAGGGPRTALRAKAPPLPEWLGLASLMILFALLYGMPTGIATWMAYWLSPDLRASNRISVYIAFLGLAGSLAGLQWAIQQNSRKGIARKVLPCLLACGLIGSSILDSGGVKLGHADDAAKREYLADRDFFRRLEEQVDPGAALFQLPVLSYPEGGVPGHEHRHLKAVLHTRQLRFSFGTLKGSEADSRNHVLGTLFRVDPQVFMQELRKEGFKGILCNRALSDNVYRLPAEATDCDWLGQHLGTPLLASPEHLYFRLPETLGRKSQDGRLLTRSAEPPSPPRSAPALAIGNLDIVKSDSSAIYLAGWALMADVDAARSQIFLRLSGPMESRIFQVLRTSRPDVQRHHPSALNASAAGFQVWLPGEMLPQGPWVVEALVKSGHSWAKIGFIKTVPNRDAPRDKSAVPRVLTPTF